MMQTQLCILIFSLSYIHIKIENVKYLILESVEKADLRYYIPTNNETAMGNNAPKVLVFNATKLNIETPQRMYPIHINTLRLPNLSDNAPINIVVNVAATELAVTIAEISAADALNIL